MGGECAGAGVVEHGGRGERDSGGGAEAVAQLHGGHGVEAQFAEGGVGFDVRRAGAAEDGGGAGPDEVQGGALSVGAGERRGRLDGGRAGQFGQHGAGGQAGPVGVGDDAVRVGGGHGTLQGDQGVTGVERG